VDNGLVDDHRSWMRRPVILVSLALGLTVLLVYGGALGHRFTLDSVSRVAQDPRVTGFEVGEILTSDWWSGAERDRVEIERSVAPRGLYRPLTLLWLGALHRLTPADDLREGRSRVINAGNLLLHAVGVILRYLLLRALLRGRRHAERLAALGGLILAVHPVATEAVCTQVGAAEGLSAVLTTTALLALLSWARRPRALPMAVHLLSVVLACAAKENALMLPGACFLTMWLGSDDGPRRALRDALPCLGAVACWWVLRGLALGEWLPEVRDPVYALYSMPVRLASALAAIGAYDLPALLWPTALQPLVTHQSLTPASGLGDPRALLGLAVLVAAAVGFVIGLRRDRLVALGLAFAALFFFPVSNLVVPIGAIAATRFLYVPLLGLVMALVAALSGIYATASRPSRIAVGVIVGAWLLAMTVITLREVPLWRDDLELFRAAARRSPTSAFGIYNLGKKLQEAGRLEDAIDAWEQAAATPQPRIPGTEHVPEDVLESVFMSAMNAGIGRHRQVEQLVLGRSSPTGNPLRQRLAQAGAAFRRAERAAGRGLEQRRLRPAASTSDWSLHRSDALVMLAVLEMLEGQLLGDRESRLARCAQARPLLAEARRLCPDNLRIDLQELALRRILGDEAGSRLDLRGLYERIRGEIGERPRAVEVAQAYGRLLLEEGRQEEGLRVILHAMLAVEDRVAPAELFERGRVAIGSGSPELRSLGAAALRRFLARTAAERSPQRRAAVELLRGADRSPR
jgi:hypothetical protein